VNDTAKVFLIQLGAALDGRIVDLSLGGCRIQTDSQFLIGIYTRVEVEFHIAGQPFRLGGVIQATQNGRQLGIRFLDMSARKREQMEQLIEDVQEVRQSGRALTPDWQAIEPWQARG
jgi:c-di-GMP-binding flagellar brake protein YcgR